MCFWSKPRLGVAVFTLLLLTLVGCQPPLKDSSQATLLQTEHWHLQVSPAHIPVETPLTMTLESSEALVQVRGELQGISMYMGRIPLQWRQAQLTAETEMPLWQAEFFLGACADPEMQWQLTLWLTYADGRTEQQHVNFISRWR